MRGRVPEELAALIPWLAGLFGLLAGSFLNVCIHRWPRDLSVVAPRSRCPGCEAQIAWYDNIPLLSWVVLGGKCRACKAPIHWRYPLVELLTAACFFGFVATRGVGVAAAKDCVFAAMLIALAATDMETRLLPDELTLGGAAVGLVFSLFTPAPGGTFAFLLEAAGVHAPQSVISLGESVTGAILCPATLWFAGWLFEKIRHKEGLGFGDVKMLAMIGAFLGLVNALGTILVASFVGSVSGLAWIALKRKDASTYELPFGTFLALAALVMAVWGERMGAWYAQSFQ